MRFLDLKILKANALSGKILHPDELAENEKALALSWGLCFCLHF
jgi:hypothetical protein